MSLNTKKKLRTSFYFEAVFLCAELLSSHEHEALCNKIVPIKDGSATWIFVVILIDSRVFHPL